MRCRRSDRAGARSCGTEAIVSFRSAVCENPGVAPAHDAEDDLPRIEEVPALVAKLYQVVDELQSIFPGRYFTPDGHLVGSLGESLAAYMFGLTLTTASTTAHDAVTEDGVRVEIKATQRKRVALSASASPSPQERLIALYLDRHGPPEVVYNGPADRVWSAAGGAQKNGQRVISLTRLRQLNAEVDDNDRLVEVRHLDLAKWP